MGWGGVGTLSLGAELPNIRGRSEEPPRSTQIHFARTPLHCEIEIALLSRGNYKVVSNLGLGVNFHENMES